MSDITKNLLIENNDFAIYGSENLVPILNDFLSYLSIKKQELLSFFHMESFIKIKINLFQNREEYYEYVSHFHTPTDYSYASVIQDTINYCYSNISKNQLLPILIKGVSHELVHIFYSCLYNGHFPRPLWIDEGLAQYLSGEKERVKQSDFVFRNFYLDTIVRRDKEIPPIDFLKEYGSEYGKFFDGKTNKYDGYALSYLFIHFLVETQNNLYEIITSEEKIKTLESTIIEDCITYYNQKYPVQSNFYAIKTDGELMDYMNKFILYGWLDNEKQEHVDTLKGFQEQYRTSSIEEILNSKIATCLGQAKLIQYWLNLKGIENKLFCLRNTSLQTDIHEIEMHCFVLFHYKENWYHFEHSAIRKRGIYRFVSLKEAIEKTSAKFLRDFDLKELTEIPTIPDHLTYEGFNQYVNLFPSYEVEKEKSI